MRYLMVGMAALQLVLIGPALAELPKPTCKEYKSAYDAMVKAPISIDDGSMLKVVQVLVDSHIYVNEERTEYATVASLMRELAGLSTEDALTWLFKTYDHLETRIQTSACTFDPPFEHKDIHLMLPKGYAYKCKAPAELPKKLPQ